MPVGPNVRIDSVAWRGFVRVILPRTTVPLSGRRAPDGRGMETVGAFEALEVEGVETIGPATLA